MLSRYLLPFLLLPIACGAADEGTSGDEDLAREPAMISLAAGSKTTIYANVTSSTSKTLQGALIAAAKRYVHVRVILKEGAHDTTWQLQQTFESNGVDVDVVKTSPVTDVVMVADTKALVGTKTVTTASSVTRYAKEFSDALDGTEPSAGSLSTTVRIWPMPESSRDRIVQLFGAAKTSIDLSIYQLQEVRVVRALTDAAARGVRVRVMLEPKTVGGQNYDAVSHELTAGGVTVKATPANFDASHNVDHAKFCLLDGKELLFGTGNLVRSGLGGVTDDVYANRDFWIEDGRATSVSEATALFEADFAGKSTTSTKLSDLVITPDNADQGIAGLIDGSKTRLSVYNQSLSDSDLITRIISAQNRGVAVRVLLGYQPAFGGSPPNQATVDKLKAAGIDVQYLERHYLHAKAIVADNEVYLGSQNFTNGGLRNNREFGEIFSGAAVTTIESIFEKDAAN